MSAPVLGNVDKQDEEQKRVTRIAKGEVPGLRSSRYTVKDKTELEAEVAANMDPKKKVGLLYALAGLRDAEYSAVGRCYLRRTALNSRYRIAYIRAIILDAIEEDASGGK